MLPKDFPQPMERFTDVPEDEDSVFGATDDEDGVTEEDDEDFGATEDDETLTATDDEEASRTVDDDDISEIDDEEFAAFCSDKAVSDDEETSTTAEEIAFSAEDENSVKFSEDIAMSDLSEDDSDCNPCVVSCSATETELSSQFHMASATPSKQNDLRCGFILSLLCRFINQPSFQPEINLPLI